MAGIAGSRALYISLFEHVRGLLPPADAVRTDPEPLTVVWTLTDMAKHLSLAVSTIRTDLVRLERYGWLEWNRRPYYLGQRIGLEYHLIADGVARNATGEERLVSREVLHLAQTSNNAPIVPAATVGRGINRKWQPE